VRVAAIDCGTNSLRLLVADAVDGALHDVHREMRIVRLGQDVDRTGVLAPEALERTRVALADYALTIASSGAQRVRMAATSATRDAGNRDDFLTMVRATLGIEPEVISGAEEAALSFGGALGGLDDVARPLLLADIGGGSTELVLGGAGDGLAAVSVNVGAVRMTERHLHDDPPTAAQIAATVSDVRAALEHAALAVPLDAAAAFVGVAGTITTLAALALGLERYDSAVVHGSRLSAERVGELTAQLLAMTRAQRAELAVIHPGRVDVIAGGALILRTILDCLGVGEVIVSEHDILDGIALSLIEPRP
jgi:exopolyphosphatase/guanosine-5'-triphosphate,3'-diphosphate pyrophosphatase